LAGVGIILSKECGIMLFSLTERRRCSSTGTIVFEALGQYKASDLLLAYSEIAGAHMEVFAKENLELPE
jgi:hypothetical protein